MICIYKNSFSNDILADVIKIKATCRWDSIAENDTEAKRKAFDLLDKEKIRSHLIKEQHGLCAYCMKKIYDDSRSTVIDHRISLKKDKEKVFDHNNLFAVCMGGQTSEDRNKVLCCDALKGDKDITIDPTNKDHMDKIRYNKTGKIYTYPEDSVLEKDINYILGLNGKIDKEGNTICDTSTGLVKGRRDAYEKFVIYIKGLEKNKKLKKSVIERLIKQLESKDEYDEYIGVMLFFLRKKINATGG